jgi:hypothetical protein
MVALGNKENIAFLRHLICMLSLFVLLLAGTSPKWGNSLFYLDLYKVYSNRIDRRQIIE